jgi:hypothetical protein
MADTKADKAAAAEAEVRAAEVKEAEKSAEPVPAEKELSLLEQAQAKAPKLTAEFVKEYKLDDEYLAKIARGEVSPPPTVGPVHNVDLHLTDGGWQITPVGLKPEDVGKDAISR